MAKQKLQIGLLLNTHIVPLWFYDMVQKIQESNHSEIKLIVTNTTNASQKNILVSRLITEPNKLLLNWHTRLETFIFKPTPDALKMLNILDILDVEEFRLHPTSNADFPIPDDTISTLKARSLDVLINYGFKDLKEPIFKIAKYGVWSYAFGDKYIENGKLASLMAMIDEHDETKVALIRMNHKSDEIHRVYETGYNTDYLLFNRNENNLHWKARTILPRRLKDLHSMDEVDFIKSLKIYNSNSFKHSTKKDQYPTSFKLIKCFLNHYWNALKDTTRRLFYSEQWILLYNFHNDYRMPPTFNNFKRILPPLDSFWADPFAIERNHKYYIFFEELVYREIKGKISVIEIDKSGNYSNPEVVLQKPYHLSYPFLFEDNDELFMLPETSENNTIELYRCADFPTRWEPAGILIDKIKSVDSTLFKHEGKYWLFTNVQSYEEAHDVNELHLFYSDTLLSDEWTPHPQNPLVTDLSSSRPAGNIFTHEGRIFRPSQNCSVHYGYGMQISEIVTLDELNYEEKHIETINPDWEKDLISTHTINRSQTLTVIDAKIKRRKF